MGKIAVVEDHQTDLACKSSTNESMKGTSNTLISSVQVQLQPESSK